MPVDEFQVSRNLCSLGPPFKSCPDRIYVLRDSRDWILVEEDYIFFWRVCVHACKLSSSWTDVPCVAFLTFDSVDSISSVVRFWLLFRIRNDSSHSFGGFVGDRDALWFKQS